jgi:hypothetical protein
LKAPSGWWWKLVSCVIGAVLAISYVPSNSSSSFMLFALAVNGAISVGESSTVTESQRDLILAEDSQHHGFVYKKSHSFRFFSTQPLSSMSTHSAQAVSPAQLHTLQESQERITTEPQRSVETDGEQEKQKSRDEAHVCQQDTQRPGHHTTNLHQTAKPRYA